MRLRWTGWLRTSSRYDPFKIPLLRHAFGDFCWPLYQFSNAEVRVTGDLGQGSTAILAGHKMPVDHPPGWRDASSQVATKEPGAR
jgi:hypothetical protein